MHEHFHHDDEKLTDFLWACEKLELGRQANELLIFRGKKERLKG